MGAGPSFASTSTVSSPSSSAIRDSANTTPLSCTRVERVAARTPGASRRAPSISASARGPGVRVDRPPLPGDAADDRPRAMGAAHLGRGERPDHVAAAADAEHERPPRAREQLVGIDHRLQQPRQLRLSLHDHAGGECLRRRGSHSDHAMAAEQDGPPVPERRDGGRRDLLASGGRVGRGQDGPARGGLEFLRARVERLAVEAPRRRVDTVGVDDGDRVGACRIDGEVDAPLARRAGRRPPPACRRGPSSTRSSSLICSYGIAAGVIRIDSPSRTLTLPEVPDTSPSRSISCAASTTPARMSALLTRPPRARSTPRRAARARRPR